MIQTIGIVVCLYVILRACEISGPERWNNKWTVTRVLAFIVGLAALGGLLDLATVGTTQTPGLEGLGFGLMR